MVTPHQEQNTNLCALSLLRAQSHSGTIGFTPIFLVDDTMETAIKPCLFIFDMNSYFARVYSIKTKNGEPAGRYDFFESVPIFALQSTLTLMQREFEYVHRAQGITCTHIALVFDHEGKNFRHDLDPSYKSNRPPKPDSWTQQERLLYNFFSQLGLPCLKIAGVEADDVIATLARNLSNKDIFSMIFSGDKDLMSLCDHHISLFAGRDTKLYDDIVVSEKFGVPCNRLLDYLTIVGDSADGVKGIPNLGPDAAVKLLNHMTLDDIIANPAVLSQHKIRGADKIGQWIQDNTDRVHVLRQLIQLKTDVTLNANMNMFHPKSPTIQDDLVGRFITSRKIQCRLAF